MKCLPLFLALTFGSFLNVNGDVSKYAGNLAISCLGDQLVPMGYAFIIYDLPEDRKNLAFFEQPENADYIDFTNQHGRVYMDQSTVSPKANTYVYIKSPCFTNREVENECVPFHRFKYTEVKQYIGPGKILQLLAEGEVDGGCI